MTITGRPRPGVVGQQARSAAGRSPALRVAGRVLRAEWRARWADWLALALVVGLAGGVVLTAAAGAQRTGTAFARLLQASHAADVSVVANGNGQAYDRALARLPEVSGLARVLLGELGYMSLVLPGGARVPSIGADISADGRWGTSVDRFKVLQGRMFRPGRADEVVIDPQLAAEYGLRPGSTLRLLMVQPGAGNRPPSRAVLPFRVAGVVVFSNQIVPVAPTDHFPELALTPAFYRSRAARFFAVGGDEALVRLRPGASLGAFTRRATQLARHYPQTQGVGLLDLADQQVKVEQAIQPQADALALFAALAGLAALVVIAQLLGRQLITGASDYPVLSALGADRRMLFMLALARAGLVSAAGGCVAVAIAIAASGMMPIGPARLAEPDPGVQVNVAILGIGLVALAVLPVLAIAPVAWRVARTDASQDARPPEPAAPSRLTRALARLGGAPTAAIGAQMAFEPGRGRSRGAGPQRDDRDGDRGRRRGGGAGLRYQPGPAGRHAPALRPGLDPRSHLRVRFGSRVRAARSGHGSVPGARRGGLRGRQRGPGQRRRPAGGRDRDPAAARRRGVPHPARRTAPRHRARDRARSPDPAATRQARRRPGVGASHARRAAGTHARRRRSDLPLVRRRRLHAHGTGGRRGRLRAPDPAQQHRLPQGPRLLRLLPHPLPARDAGHGDLGAGEPFRVGADRRGCPPGTCQALTAAAPAAISNYSQVRATPLALGGLLALLAVALMAQALLTTTRRRRRDLAVVKTLGFLRRQVSAAVAWQATALAAVTLLVGLPLGVAGGRWAWALFAGSVGVGSGAAVPLSTIALVVPATLLLANAIAVGPGWAAARVRPAVALRTE